VSASDPDRFFNRTTPGAHEWWYFDANSDDGRDAIVIVWYAGLPFDPSYGVATLRHLKNPAKYPQPRALDHSAIGFSWYRHGKAIAYALNAFEADHFRHQAEPFSVEVATSRLERDGEGYTLTIATPSVAGQPIRAEFRFTPAASTEPFERDLGTPEAPHNWLMAACDCRVEGKASFGGEDQAFNGRGYHDHNAGAEDLSVAMKRWEWGRFHHGTATEIYYVSTPRRGNPQSLWISCENGRPSDIREELMISGVGWRGVNYFGLRNHNPLFINSGLELLSQLNGPCVDDGPFYRRWVPGFERVNLAGGDPEGQPEPEYPGISELLDTRNLHKPWFNWMIPFRLKWPRT
jgi:carotenoid 1,2-hydratase